jgi:SRP-independent targeting protein 2/TMEM208
MVVPTIISLVLRFLLRKDTLPPSKGSLAIYIVTFFPAFFLSNYLVKIGTTRRDPTTGTLISYGEDLSQTGVTEWCFDILYVTCQSVSLPLVVQANETAAGTCQIGSGAFGEWFWWLYMVVRPS